MIAPAADTKNRPRGHSSAGGRAAAGMSSAAAHADSSAPFGLTDKGRVVAVLATLRDRWERLTPDQQAEARALVDRLVATYRTRPAVRVPLAARLMA